MQHIQRIFQERSQNIQKRNSQLQIEFKHYLIMNEIRDDDGILQIATERGDSCGNRRHEILLTTHSTFTQQTHYTDNKATLNEKQFFLPPFQTPHHGWVSQGGTI